MPAMHSSTQIVPSRCSPISTPHTSVFMWPRACCRMRRITSRSTMQATDLVLVLDTLSNRCRGERTEHVGLIPRNAVGNLPRGGARHEYIKCREADFSQAAASKQFHPRITVHRQGC